ncbi:MAG: nucleotidyltransferase family protein, partial [Patescibacteria group bacterium]
MSSQEIINKIKENKDFLMANYAISEIGLFGSVARGEDNEKSDIDLFVSFEDRKSVSLFDLIHIKHYFEDLFGKKIDLIHKPMIR